MILIVFICKIAYANAIKFADSNVPEQSISIAAVGDLLLHYPLQIKALKTSYTSLWEEAIPILKQTDIAYANLEGPISGGAIANYPAFNYDIRLAPAIKQSGIDIVSLSNNHILDQGVKGLEYTIKTLDKTGIQHVGARSRNSESSWYTLVTRKGFKIAWIGCTIHVNDNEDKYKQVLYCYKNADRFYILNLIKLLRTQVDAIIVVPHWGKEYELKPTNAQIKFAHQLLDAGALAVLGSHPHVLQPLEKYITQDGRETLIIYSLGNFVSYQGSPARRATIILLLNLAKNSKGVVIRKIHFIPFYMENRNGLDKIKLRKIGKKDKFELEIIGNVLPLQNAILDDSK